MGPRELALRYLDVFVGREPIETMLDLLHASDFRFAGPFFEFDSAEAYVRALRDDPALDCSYEPITVLEQGTEACVLYEFRRGELRTPMAQLFRVRDERIHGVLLIFDSASFAESAR